jgi:hypothetical protein
MNDMKSYGEDEETFCWTSKILLLIIGGIDIEPVTMSMIPAKFERLSTREKDLSS